MILSIVTPNKKLVIDKEVEEVIIPGFKGELTIYDGHAPLITTLDIGLLQFREKIGGEAERFAISWGYCEIAGNIVKVLAETAESSGMIDKIRAKETLEKSQVILDTDKELSLEDTQKYMSKVKKAQTRLDV